MAAPPMAAPPDAAARSVTPPSAHQQQLQLRELDVPMPPQRTLEDWAYGAEAAYPHGYYREGGGDLHLPPMRGGGEWHDEPWYPHVAQSFFDYEWALIPAFQAASSSSSSTSSSSSSARRISWERSLTSDSRTRCASRARARSSTRSGRATRRSGRSGSIRRVVVVVVVVVVVAAVVGGAVPHVRLGGRVVAQA